MNIFKIRLGAISSHVINIHNFEDETRKEAPYYNRDILSNGRIAHMAICPSCENPIQIINLYNINAKTKPYARHYPNSVPYLANYNQDNYDSCLLTSQVRAQLDKGARKQRLAGQALEILKAVINQFDRIIYLLGKILGLKITENLAKSMLINYLAGEGYLYKYASLNNIPWIFAYFANSQSLVNRVIYQTELIKAILAKTPLVLNKDNQLTKPEGRYVNLSFFCQQHRAIEKDGNIEECMDFSVDFEDQEVYKQEIIFDTTYFSHLVNKDGNENMRNHKMLKLAKDICTAKLPNATLNLLKLQ